MQDLHTGLGSQWRNRGYDSLRTMNNASPTGKVDELGVFGGVDHRRFERHDESTDVWVDIKPLVSDAVYNLCSSFGNLLVNCE